MSALPPGGSAPGVNIGAPPVAGWFGKIPALGDFVSRRLPPEFIELWDEWLSEELFGARGKLGEDWLEAYLKAPIWRFALMPGALDDRHWFGVLMPSVDRVGRQFPLTFAASFAPQLDSLNRWWSTLIGVAMRAKDSSCDADALEAALLDSPDNQVPDEGREPFEHSMAPALAAAPTGTSLWWSWQPDAAEAETLAVLQGMPRGDRFLELIHPGFAGTRDSQAPPEPSIVHSTHRSGYMRYAYIVLIVGGVSLAWWLHRTGADAQNRYETAWLDSQKPSAALAIALSDDEATITLTRTGCFGMCPEYSVRIRGSGRVEFFGNRYVCQSRPAPIVIDRSAVAQLVHGLSVVDFNRMPSYAHKSTGDLPTATIEFRQGHSVHVVQHNHEDRAAPRLLSWIEQRIDEVARTSLWLGHQEDSQFMCVLPNGTKKPITLSDPIPGS